MCLAVPAKIVDIECDFYTAEVEIIGNRKKISVALTPEAKIGNWVLVHAGEAISVISMEEADASLKVWEQLLNE